MESFGSENNGSPFVLFPEEVWDLILDEVEDSKDISTVFNTFPQLTSLCRPQRKRSFSWLIGELMPLIAPKYLNFKEILKCRLVSRRWKNAVDFTLESHPDRHTHQELLKFPTRTMSEIHPNYQKLPNFKTGRDLFVSSKKRNEIMNSPEGSNPFVGRQLTLAYRLRGRNDSYADQLRIALPMLQKFGINVWYVEFCLPFFSHFPGNHTKDIKDILQVLMECLVFLPNLKSLKITGNLALNYDDCNEIVAQVWGSNSIYSTAFHGMKQLETLNLTGLAGIKESILTKLLGTFIIGNNSGLKMLTIDSTVWDPKFGTFLPSLVELHLESKYLCPSRIYKLMQQILKQLSGLRKLKITNIANLNTPQFLETLTPYRIQALELTGVQVRKYQPYSTSAVLVPSIQQLRIEDDYGLDFNFLEQLPNLQSLFVERIAGRRYKLPKVSTYTGNYKLNDIIRTCCYKMNDEDLDEFVLSLRSDIWNKLPVLKTLIVEEKGCIRRRHFRDY